MNIVINELDISKQLTVRRTDEECTYYENSDSVRKYFTNRIATTLHSKVSYDEISDREFGEMG